MRAPVSAALDAAAILIFVGIGRSVHADGASVGDLASTAWPFLTGAGLGWIAARAWRRPADLVPGGAVVWLACVGLGMVLRVLAGQGTAVAFVLVALAFLGAALLGWRALALAVATRRSREREPVASSTPRRTER